MKTISGSVGQGGRNINGDVRTVQQLLNDAGPAPGAAPLVVDGFVGPLTIAAIKAFQLPNIGFADGRVDPNGPTLAALNRAAEPPSSDKVRCGSAELGGGSGRAVQSAAFAPVRFSVGGGTAAPQTAALPRDEAVAKAPEAMLWVAAALAALQLVRNGMQSGLTADLQKLQGTVELTALNTHFHLDKSNNPLKFLGDLGRNYSLISISVAGAATNFANDLLSSDFANADPGGFARRNDKTNPGRMFFCPKYLGMGPLSKVATILHEAGHYISKDIDHFASSVPFPDGRAIDATDGTKHSKTYSQLSPDEAFKNASSYAAFAIHCFKRADTRPVVAQ